MAEVRLSKVTFTGRSISMTGEDHSGSPGEESLQDRIANRNKDVFKMMDAILTVVLYEVVKFDPIVCFKYI